MEGPPQDRHVLLLQPLELFGDGSDIVVDDLFSLRILIEQDTPDVERRAAGAAALPPVGVALVVGPHVHRVGRGVPMPAEADDPAELVICDRILHLMAVAAVVGAARRIIPHVQAEDGRIFPGHGIDGLHLFPVDPPVAELPRERITAEAVPQEAVQALRLGGGVGVDELRLHIVDGLRDPRGFGDLQAIQQDPALLFFQGDLMASGREGRLEQDGRAVFLALAADLPGRRAVDADEVRFPAADPLHGKSEVIVSVPRNADLKHQTAVVIGEAPHRPAARGVGVLDDLIAPGKPGGFRLINGAALRLRAHGQTRKEGERQGGRCKACEAFFHRSSPPVLRASVPKGGNTRSLRLALPSTTGPFSAYTLPRRKATDFIVRPLRALFTIVIRPKR